MRAPTSTLSPQLLALASTPAPPHLPTGLPPIDAALGGGLRAGVVAEVVGSAGAGKTQLCLSLAAAALAAAPGAGVVWVDAEGAFSAARLAEVAAAAAGGLGARAARAALADRVAVLPAPASAEALIATLVDIAARAGVGGRPLALVVVDSAPAVVDAGGALPFPLRTLAAASLATALKAVAEACACPVVAVNQVSPGGGGRGAAVAALGARWAHAVGTRIVLEAGGRNSMRWARLVKAPASPDAAAPFVVRSGGVAPPPPPLPGAPAPEPPPRPAWVDYEGGVLDAPLWAEGGAWEEGAWGGGGRGSE